MTTQPVPSRLRWIGIRLLQLLAILFVLALVVFGITGDGGAVQAYVNRIEQRALEGRSTNMDQVVLRVLYRSMLITGSPAFPEAAVALNHYIAGRRDTLWIESNYITQHPDVLEAVKQHKKGVLFGGHGRMLERFYYPKQIDPRMYYLFHLMHIRYLSNGKVLLHDWYYFQPLRKASYTTYPLGRVRFRLRDGLIHVAYPNAHRTGFVTCCRMAAAQ